MNLGSLRTDEHPSTELSTPASKRARESKLRFSISSQAASESRRRWSRLSLLLLALASLVGFAAYAWVPRAVAVDVGVARQGPLRVFITDEGVTRVREHYIVSSPLTGNLVRLDWNAGDWLEEGTAVARVLPAAPALLDERTRAEAEARLIAARAREQQAKTAVHRALAARDAAARDAARARALRRDAVVSQSELEHIELLERLAIEDVAVAEHAQRAAHSDVKAAEAALGHVAKGNRGAIAVEAPAAGRVLRVLRKSEGPVAFGASLLEFGDLQSLEAVVDVLSSDAARITVGARVELRQWGHEEPFFGHVRLIEPSAFTHISALGVEEQRVNVVIALDDAPKRLGDGYRVDASILIWEADSVLKIPTASVFTHDGGWATYVLRDGRAVLTPLTLGHRTELEAEVRNGLLAGARVILYPGPRVVEGARVKPR